MDMKETTELDTSLLSALLRQAIGDMDRRLGTGYYRARGGVWHQPAEESDGLEPVAKCEIDLAGANCARWKIGWDEEILPSDMPERARPAFRALDWLRRLHVTSAYVELRGSYRGASGISGKLLQAGEETGGQHRRRALDAVLQTPRGSKGPRGNSQGTGRGTGARGVGTRGREARG